MWPLLLLPLILPEPTSVVRARGELRELVVAEARSLRGYSRERFMPSWTEAEGACDTREVVLRRDAVSVTTDLDCEAVRGTWFSEYDGLTLHSEEQIDVDHLVQPGDLAAAAQVVLVHVRAGVDHREAPLRADRHLPGETGPPPHVAHLLQRSAIRLSCCSLAPASPGRPRSASRPATRSRASTGWRPSYLNLARASTTASRSPRRPGSCRW